MEQHCPLLAWPQIAKDIVARGIVSVADWLLASLSANQHYFCSEVPSCGEASRYEESASSQSVEYSLLILLISFRINEDR